MDPWGKVMQDIYIYIYIYIYILSTIVKNQRTESQKQTKRGLGLKALAWVGLAKTVDDLNPALPLRTPKLWEFW